MNPALISRYNVAAPRYTSYPVVPEWDTAHWSKEAWLETVKIAYNESQQQGLSIYIHLPYCEDLCTYCGCNTRITKNHAVEKPYIHAVLQEWQMYCSLLGCQPLIREIHLGGGTPTFFSAENLQLLLSGILSGATLAANADLSFEAHPANTTAAHLTTLYALGFRRLSLGIQDFDPRVQEIINRKQSVAQVYNVTNIARKTGYTSINFDLVYGLPLQNASGLKNTIEEVIKLLPERIAFYSYAHVPWVKPGQRKFTEAHLPTVEEKLALYNLGREMLLAAGYKEVGMDHFALETDTLYAAVQENKLFRNFMGYTPHHTQLTIGLGVSSISDSWYCYAQNVKTVEAYLQCIADHQFPLMKGHLLSKNELAGREKILEVMCRNVITLPNNLSEEAQAYLQGLNEDGLIELCAGQMTITTTGRSFLRNIAMVFDAYQTKQAPVQKFSMTI